MTADGWADEDDSDGGMHLLCLGADAADDQRFAAAPVRVCLGRPRLAATQ